MMHRELLRDFPKCQPVKLMEIRLLHITMRDITSLPTEREGGDGSRSFLGKTNSCFMGQQKGGETDDGFPTI